MFINIMNGTHWKHVRITETLQAFNYPVISFKPVNMYDGCKKVRLTT
jgi:hypothetical protein